MIVAARRNLVVRNTVNTHRNAKNPSFIGISCRNLELVNSVMDRQILASSSSSTSGNSANPPPPEDAWFNTYLKLTPQWQSVHTEMIPVEISRVNQVDAGRLDVEMSAMLKEQLVKVFSLLKPGMLFQYEPELDAFLEFLIWRFSIWVDKPTPGNALMNLRYRDERAVEPRVKVRMGLEGPGLTVSQKIWYCIATVGGQYIWARLQSFSAFRRWGDTEQRSLARRGWFILQRIEGFYKAASFGNLLIFLLTGRYRSLTERALRARLVYGSPNMNRSVSFEYMNRQLVWNEFSEMLLLLLPLLNSSSLRKVLRPFSKDKSSNSEGDDALCPICQTTPTTPFLALPCQHRYCYYCLRTRCASMSFRCSRCSEPVVAMQRHGDCVSSET
ncbi:peroxisome biogenesis protein 2-like isoform X1 [Salvia splendens]|uniref:peroxisome biogenesis protein 2-like isoform X1 n=2 Tax=Salvia splendens TaxID=180675 RepID=UPI001C2520CE|nr:peroxisome biogenesis protein 2-like isoform X1 [Salvia splendens]